MRINLSKRIPEGEWSSFNEPVGVGDAEKREFLLPFPAKEARGLLLIKTDMESLGFIEREGKISEARGDEIAELPDGYHTEETEGGGLKVIFDRAPGQGVAIGACVFGRRVGDAFKVFPLVDLLQNKIDELAGGNMKKKPGDQTRADRAAIGRANVTVLVSDWTATDEAGSPLPCDAETKKAFLSQFDPFFFGLWVFRRAMALAVEKNSRLEADAGN